MRRFFQPQRDEECGRIQYLTAKCARLAHDNATLEREVLLFREQEKRHQEELLSVTSQLLLQEQTSHGLRVHQDQLLSTIHQQQDLVDILQQRLGLLVEESAWEEELLRQVCSELLCLQSSEERLQGLVEELHAEALHRAAVAESLQVELHSKAADLEELQDVNRELREELEDLRKAYYREVGMLRRENEGSLRKLRETAQQCEWLGEQQRAWMCCVKKFKGALMEEREALLRRVSELETNVEELKTRPLAHVCALQGTKCAASWDAEAEARWEAEAQREESDSSYEELPDQGH